ncbi:hypothetical protein HAHE_25140 [Haloferula helveola]|uniref:Uncharacterized protein n=1 Tax=Haloferula helveola TaxID=490095 RepID=A0ABM7RAX3_9BACT|nr:hypothetical protein HAHE_25140 [Haloferula helveola]
MNDRQSCSQPTRILLDNGIVTHRSRMHWTRVPVPHPQSGFYPHKLLVAERLPPYPNPGFEAELEAIFTVGRLIRERKVEAFSSIELKSESFRDRLGGKPIDALAGCTIGMVPNPIERGKFVRAELGEFIRKGGKKDRLSGHSRTSQISFFRWLCQLGPEAAGRIVADRQTRGLSPFECESFAGLDWFRAMARRLRSDENLPDAFYVWTAKRSSLDVFLTLDLRLVNAAAAIEREKSGFRLGVRVRSPIQLLADEGIDEPDPYPCEPGRQYTMAEIARLAPF